MLVVNLRFYMCQIMNYALLNFLDVNMVNVFVIYVFVAVISEVSLKTLK